jgi:hypothetical protein
LLPGQDLLALRPKIFGNLQLAARVLRQELLFDRFVEDGFQIGTCLLHLILGHSFRQIVDMRLQHEPVNRVEGGTPRTSPTGRARSGSFHLRRLRSPIPLAQWEIAVANKPSENSRTVFEDPATREILASLFSDFHPQRFSRLGPRHPGFEVERNTN